MANQQLTVAQQRAQAVAAFENDFKMHEGQFMPVLPEHVPIGRFRRLCVGAMRANPDIVMNCERVSILRACLTAATLGLTPDGVLGQGYIIRFRNQAQFIPGYRGLLTLVRNTGEITSVRAETVHENDHFDFMFGLSERLEHKPAMGDRGDMKFAYAIAHFRDGGTHFEVMTAAQVYAIRDASPNYNPQSPKGPWKDHPEEMARKTVIRRLCKYLPMDVNKIAMAVAATDQEGGAPTVDPYSYPDSDAAGEGGGPLIDGEATETTDDDGGQNQGDDDPDLKHVADQGKADDNSSAQNDKPAAADDNPPAETENPAPAAETKPAQQPKAPAATAKNPAGSAAAASNGGGQQQAAQNGAAPQGELEVPAFMDRRKPPAEQQDDAPATEDGADPKADFIAQFKADVDAAQSVEQAVAVQQKHHANIQGPLTTEDERKGLMTYLAERINELGKAASNG